MRGLTTGLLALCVVSCSATSAGDAAVVTGGVSRQGADRGPVVATELVLRMDEPARIAGTALELVWTRTADSRCPRGAECVWEGEVTVTLRLSNREVEPPDHDDLELTLPGLRPGKTTDRSRATVNGSRLVLLGVEPHPRSGVQTSESAYRARIRLAPESEIDSSGEVPVA